MNLATRFEEGWQVAWTRIDDWVGGFFTLLPNIIVGTLVLGLFCLLALAVRSSVRASFRRRQRGDLGEMLASFLLWLISLLGLLVALTIILPTLAPGDLVASLGVGSVAIGFAFKDILQNWLAGLLILLRQPFRRGDQIRVGEIEGTVHRINQRATLIRTYDNRMVVVPNADIYTSSVTVHTAYPTRRITLDVTVGYDNDVEAVRALVADTLARLDEVLPDPPPQVICWDLGATSLGFKVRFWIESKRSCEIAARGRAIQAIKEAFQRRGIDPTDPQIVLSRVISRVEETPAHPMKPEAGDAAPSGELPSRLAAPPGDPEAEVPQEPADPAIGTAPGPP